MNFKNPGNFVSCAKREEELTSREQFSAINVSEKALKESFMLSSSGANPVKPGNNKRKKRKPKINKV
jgi:hypothetical protein